MFPAPSTKLFLPQRVLDPFKEHNRVPLQEREMGFAPDKWKRGKLGGNEEDDEEQEGGVVALEQKGGESEGFIVIAVVFMVVKILYDVWEKSFRIWIE